MKVHNSYLIDSLNKLIAIDNKNYLNTNDKDGDIGERFVKDSIKYYMWEKGFKVRSTGNRTFYIEEQYGSDKKRGNEGIDFRFGFVHNMRRYDCYIESKNWNVYPITPSIFKKEILDRFTMNANQLGCVWILTMNKKNIPSINTKCIANNIHIVPIDMKITSSQLNTNSLRIIMEHFLEDFHKLMEILTRVRLRKSVKRRSPNSKRYDKAIVLGLPPTLIASMFNTTLSNVQKRKSVLKSEGIDVLDGRSQTARYIRLITVDELNKIHKKVIRRMFEEKRV